MCAPRSHHISRGRQAAAQKQDAPPDKFKQQKHCKQRSDGIPEIEISVPEPRKVAGRPAERTRLPGHPQIAAAPDLRQQKPHCPCKNRQCGPCSRRSRKRSS